MFCKNCGTELKDGAQFCHGCGAKQGSENPVNTQAAEPVFNAPVRNEVIKPKKKFPKWIIPVAAAALVLIIAAIVLICIFNSPSAVVARALAKSSNEFISVIEKTPFADAGSAIDKKENSQYVSMWVENSEYEPELNGVGIRASIDSNISKRKIGMELTPYFGSADLLKVQMKVDNQNIYLGSPEITNGTFYSVNTMSIGSDFHQLLYNLMYGFLDVHDSNEFRNISFNIFDFIEQMEEINSLSKEEEKIIRDACSEFVKTIEIEKTGSSTVPVNGNYLKCKAYHVRMYGYAINQLLYDLENACTNMNSIYEYRALFRAMGMPDALVDPILELFGGDDSVNYIFESMREVVNELGNIELDVYINKGRIAAVSYRAYIEGMNVEVVLNIGGGKNYVDNISIKLITEYGEMALVSNGNHTGEGDMFSDITVLSLESYGEKENLFEMQTSYFPKAQNNNFMWSMTVEDETLSANGHITCSKDEISVYLGEIKLEDYLVFGLEYRIGEYKGDNISIGNSVSISGMTEDMMYNEIEKLGENLLYWLEDLMYEFPDLAYYFY